MLGATATAFYINNAASILPRHFMAKTSAYVSGAAADVLEVKRNEGLYRWCNPISGVLIVAVFNRLE